MSIPLHPWQMRAAERAFRLAAHRGVVPRLLILLGSGLGCLPEDFEVVTTVSLDELTGIRAPEVPGHRREVVLGWWRGIPVWFCLGRYHLYQGLTAAMVASPVVLLARLPVQCVVLTNAAGSLNPALSPGQLVLIEDHLFVPGLAGQHPLIPPAGQVAFFSAREAYDAGLRVLLRGVAQERDYLLPEGTYAMVAGPTFETTAELRWLRAAGADLAGMSTVPEVLMARALRLRVAALSVVTNWALPEVATIPTHEEVAERAATAAPLLLDLLRSALPQLVRDE